MVLRRGLQKKISWRDLTFNRRLEMLQKGGHDKKEVAKK